MSIKVKKLVTTVFANSTFPEIKVLVNTSGNDFKSIVIDAGDSELSIYNYDSVSAIEIAEMISELLAEVVKDYTGY